MNNETIPKNRLLADSDCYRCLSCQGIIDASTPYMEIGRRHFYCVPCGKSLLEMQKNGKQ